jgi:hypothetical protein
MQVLKYQIAIDFFYPDGTGAVCVSSTGILQKYGNKQNEKRHAKYLIVKKMFQKKAKLIRFF